MKTPSNRLILLLGLIGLVLGLSFGQAAQKAPNEPSEDWLISGRDSEGQTIHDPQGLVRTKAHAEEIGKLALKWLIHDPRPVKSKQVGVYWIVYTFTPKTSGPPPKSNDYYVQISSEDGGLRSWGHCDFD